MKTDTRQIGTKKLCKISGCFGIIVEEFYYVYGIGNGVIGPGFIQEKHISSRYFCPRCGVVYIPTDYNKLEVENEKRLQIGTKSLDTNVLKKIKKDIFIAYDVSSGVAIDLSSYRLFRGDFVFVEISDNKPALHKKEPYIVSDKDGKKSLIWWSPFIYIDGEDKKSFVEKESDPLPKDKERAVLVFLSVNLEISFYVPEDSIENI
jgi:hypothetical protein